MEGAAMRNGIVPGHWTGFYEVTHIPAAVRDGDRLYVTGHTGEDQDGNFSADPDAQIRHTFHNVGATLSKAGASWADIAELNSYHVGSG
jgi:enamine deaminase RidA (YjgF/YER057c/UK114 family)